MDNINPQRKTVYLAALLHDIGKFYQRASGNMGENDSNLSMHLNKIEEYICPEDLITKKRTHKHVLWTNSFLENNSTLTKIKEQQEYLFRVSSKSADNLCEDNLTNLAANHHAPHPESDMQKIVQMADWWSAGMCRVSSGEDDHAEFNYHGLTFSDFRSVPLFSVFNQVHVDGNLGSDSSVAYSLKPLSIDGDSIFPERLNQINIKCLKEQYAKLWQGFEEEFAHLPSNSFSGFEESLFYLLKKYTWCIPSNARDMANVSLFDHLKTTAAIADSLYMAWKDNAFSKAFHFSGKGDYLNQGYYPLMMVGVDLSGIQSFIYDVASKKAAQSLKGRSFYLQLLMDAILQKFKEAPIHAKAANTLYSSGGKAYLLLANTNEINDKIFGKGGIKEVVENELWEEHTGRISINIACVGFAYHSRREDNSWQTWVETEGHPGCRKYISHVWKALSEKLTRQKNQKFKTRVINHFDEYFDETHSVLQAGGNTEGNNGVKTCAVTGEEISGKGYPIDNNIFVTGSVKNQTDLGKCLKDADYILSLRGIPQEDKCLSNWTRAKAKVLSSHYYLLNQKDFKNNAAEFRTQISSAGVLKVSTINKASYLKDFLKGQKVSYGYEFYGGNEQAYHRDVNGFPKNKIDQNNKELFNTKNEKTFNELAQISSGKNTLLGILRMDIDDLGKLFIEGFSPSHLSLSAYATLSFQLELFFSGYLNTLRDMEMELDENGAPKKDRNGNPVYQFRDWINILYSGGDDLFVVGRWDKTLEFAEAVRSRFGEFTKRKDISISGGTAFVHQAFPLAKAAKMAGEAESASKALKGKNAMTFFGQTVSWDIEFKVVKGLKNKLVKYITRREKPLSKAILHKLMLYNALKDKHLNNQNRKPDFSFLWHTAYYLKRYVDKYKPKENQEDRETVEFVLNDLQEKLFESSKNEFRYYELAALAARWAETELKDRDKEEINEAE